MLISLHMPKTAGNSFLKSLSETFAGKLLQDYTDMPLIQQYYAGILTREEVCEKQILHAQWSQYQCIHGHFLGNKYYAQREQYPMTFITWLRDPVERLISNYHFFKRSYDPATAGILFRKVIEKNWSLEQFCFSDEYKNFYGKYLWDVPYDAFDFIGVTEFYEEDLHYFSEKFLNTRLDAFRLNCSTGNKASVYDIDPGFRREVESFHSDDLALYTRALEDREQRL